MIQWGGVLDSVVWCYQLHTLQHKTETETETETGGY
jgi:hypothetical protein